MPKRTEPSSTALSKVLIDTHVAVWLAEGHARILAQRKLLQDAYENGTLLISAISAWEIGMLVSKRRLLISKDPLLWFNELTTNFGIAVIDVTSEIAIKSNFLAGSMHGDPADRLIIATAQIYFAALMTGDRMIQSYGKACGVRTIRC